MSFTDKTVYKLRKATDDYANLAIEHRKHKEQNEILLARCKKEGLMVDRAKERCVPEQQNRQDKLKNNQDKFINNMESIIAEYIKVKEEDAFYKKQNSQLKRMLEQKGIK